MSWIQTYTGKKFDPFNLDGEMIDIEDIAHGLSMTCRYGGHCDRFYSVAEHSILLSEKVMDSTLSSQYNDTAHKLVLYALLHDASEAYIGDMPRPIKAFMPQFQEIEEKIQSVVIQKYFSNHKPSQKDMEFVHQLDTEILSHEAKQMMGQTDWVNSLPETDGWPEIKFYEPRIAKEKFLERFDDAFDVFLFHSVMGIGTF